MGKDKNSRSRKSETNNSILEQQQTQSHRSPTLNRPSTCKRPTGITAKIKAARQQNKCDPHFIIQSPGDGHCLLHSVVTAFNKTGTPSTKIDVDLLKVLIRSELTENEDAYCEMYGFTPSGLQVQMNDYFIQKRYDCDLCDIMPSVISAVVHVNISIFNHTAQGVQVINIKTNEKHCRTIFLQRLRDHYNAVVPKFLRQHKIQKIRELNSQDQTRPKNRSSASKNNQIQAESANYTNNLLSDIDHPADNQGSRLSVGDQAEVEKCQQTGTDSPANAPEESCTESHSQGSLMEPTPHACEQNKRQKWKKGGVHTSP